MAGSSIRILRAVRINQTHRKSREYSDSDHVDIEHSGIVSFIGTTTAYLRAYETWDLVQGPALPSSSLVSAFSHEQKFN